MILVKFKIRKINKMLSIGDRMKNYENVTRHYLTKRVPVIIRIDGKTFHTFTKKYFKKGFSAEFSKGMELVTLNLMKELGAKIGYTQSDEISLLLTDYKTIKTDAQFGYNLSKLISVSASIATSEFAKYLLKNTLINEFPYFDSRVFNIPEDDVCNYFIWRQEDCIRNAISMIGQQHYSPKQLNRVSTKQLKEKLISEHNFNFDSLSSYQLNGILILRTNIEGKSILHTLPKTPIIKNSREVIEKIVNEKEY